MHYIKIPAPLLAEIVGYLSTRPYREVIKLIKAIDSDAVAVKEESSQPKLAQK